LPQSLDICVHERTHHQIKIESFNQQSLNSLHLRCNIFHSSSNYSSNWQQTTMFFSKN